MVTLIDAGYADQNDVARAFGCSTRSLRRYQAHYEAAGLEALVRGPGRPPSAAVRSSRSRRRDQTILALKTRAASNRTIAGTLGIDERVVRRTLRRLGWRPAPDARLPFSEQMPAVPAVETATSVRRQVVLPLGGIPSGRTTDDVAEAVPISYDVDPLDRSMDRLLAAMGQLDDAAPRFAATDALPGAGVLLAVPALVASGRSRWRARCTVVSAPPSTDCARRWSPTCCWSCCAFRGRRCSRSMRRETWVVSLVSTACPR